MWRLYTQVSTAVRSMNRLWHEMAAAAVGSCIHVYRGSWGATGISVSLSKETGRGAALPGGHGTSAAEHLAVILTFFSLFFFLTSTGPLSGNSLPRRHSISLSLHFPKTALSPSRFSREPAVPRRPVCASAEMISILSGGGFIVLLLTISATCATLRAPVCLRILKSERLHVCSEWRDKMVESV